MTATTKLRILVTGTTGWLGSNLAAALTADGHQVVGASRRKTEIDGLDSALLDVSSSEEVSAFFETYATFDAIVHLGWCDMETAVETNIGGTRRVVEAGLKHGCRKFVVASSVAAIATAAPTKPPLELPMPANHPCVGGPWPYGVSMAHCEDVLRVIAAISTVDILCVRIGNTVTDPPEIVHHDGMGIKYPVEPATSHTPRKNNIFPEAALCSVAISDQVRCLSLATTAPFVTNRFEVIACVAPRAYSAEPVVDLLRAWYGDERAMQIRGIEKYTEAGSERKPIYDLRPAYEILGWKPEIDLTANVPLVRRHRVFLDIEKRVEAKNTNAWLAMAKELVDASRAEAGCVFYDFVQVHNQPHQFRIMECWRDDIALDEHATSEHFRKLVPAMDAISTTCAVHKGGDALTTTPDEGEELVHATKRRVQPVVDKKVQITPRRSLTTPNFRGRVGKILILYDSSTSCTKLMAHLVAEGCRQLDHTEVKVRVVPGDSNHWDQQQKPSRNGGVDLDATYDDILWADGLACGSATNLGCVSWRFKRFWDNFSQTGYWGRCDGKIGCAFSSVGGSAVGGELVCMAINQILMNFGFTIFGITDYVDLKNTLHYGAVSAKAPRSDKQQMACRRLGTRLAELVGYYIVHRTETHPLLASTGREAAVWGGGPIPPRSAWPAGLLACNTAPFVDARPTCLVFTKAKDYVHQSSPAACSFVARLAENRGYRAVVTSDGATLSWPNEWDVICLVNLSGDAFDLESHILLDHINAGKGILGLHAALACFLSGADAVDRTELGHTTELVADIFGCHFKNHPPPQRGAVVIEHDTLINAFDGEFKDSALAALPDKFHVYDEFFNFDRVPKNVTVLASLDEGSYGGGTMGFDHPIIWAKQNPGRVFYCGLGHFDAAYNGFDMLSDYDLVARCLASGFAFVGGPDPIHAAMTSPS